MQKWILAIGCGLLAACSNGTPSGGNANAVTPPAPSPQSISGTYVAWGHDASTDEAFVEGLRLTQSGAGQFTGTLESTAMNQAGKSHSSTQNVTGSYDGVHVSISLDQGIGHTNRNATWTPGAITMTWMQKDGQLGQETFVSKTDAEYAELLQRMGTARETLVENAEGAKRAQEADKEAAQLVSDLRRFLDKEATWDLGKADQRHKRSVAYGDEGIAKIKQLLASHQSLAEVTASNVSVSMNTTGIQLGLALDNDLNAVGVAQRKMVNMDRLIEQSPCLAPDGSLVPNPLPSCAPLPALVAKYRSVHRSAEAILSQINSIDVATRADYEERSKEAERLVSRR
jgi:hypothetical protein